MQRAQLSSRPDRRSEDRSHRLPGILRCVLSTRDHRVRSFRSSRVRSASRQRRPRADRGRAPGATRHAGSALRRGRSPDRGRGLPIDRQPTRAQPAIELDSRAQSEVVDVAIVDGPTRGDAALPVAAGEPVCGWLEALPRWAQPGLNLEVEPGTAGNSHTGRGHDPARGRDQRRSLSVPAAARTWARLTRPDCRRSSGRRSPRSIRPR